MRRCIACRARLFGGEYELCAECINSTLDDGFSLNDESEHAVSCPLCAGPATLLGDLGNVAHFRCINCGGNFNRKVNT